MLFKGIFSPGFWRNMSFLIYYIGFRYQRVIIK